MVSCDLLNIFFLKKVSNLEFWILLRLVIKAEACFEYFEA